MQRSVATERVWICRDLLRNILQHGIRQHRLRRPRPSRMFEQGQLHGEAQTVMATPSCTDPSQLRRGERVETYELARLRR